MTSSNLYNSRDRNQPSQNLIQAGILVGLRSLFDKDWFDITQLRNLLKLANREYYFTKKDEELFYTLHCVHYKVMVPGMKEALQQRVEEILGIVTITDVRFKEMKEPEPMKEVKIEPARKPTGSSLLRFITGR